MQKLSSLIFKQTTRTLAATGAVIALALWLYSMAEVMRAGQHAEKLIASQALGSASAASNAQNVMALQPELERFVDDWNRDEALEARAEVYLDGNLVAKAGPAQPFRWVYSSVHERKTLPSGAQVEVRVDIFKWKYWLQVLLEGLVLELLVLGLFFLLKRRLGRVSAELSDPLRRLLAGFSRSRTGYPIRRKPWGRSTNRRSWKFKMFELRFSRSRARSLARRELGPNPF